MALERAREETKNIKYADMHMEIINAVSNIAEDNGIEMDEYNINQVYHAKNKLECGLNDFTSPGPKERFGTNC